MITSGASHSEKSPSSPRLRNLLILAIVGVGVAGVAVYAAYAGGYLQGGSGSGGPSLMHATCSSLGNSSESTVEHVANGGSGNNAYFLIVEADPPSPYAGMNGSYYVPPSQQWPTMNVKLGQTVSIHVINCASSEAHGIQVQHYGDKQVIAISTGQSYDFNFTANEVGTFRVYCDIFCAIHPLMQNGALVVTA